MYGPPPAQEPTLPHPRPPAHPPTDAKTLIVRWLFALIPIGTLGLLAWVPSLRFAILRGRGIDWAVFGLFCSLTAGEILLIAFVPDDESNYSAFAGFYALSFFIGATIHAVRADRFPRHPPAHHPYAHTPAPAPPHAHTLPTAPLPAAPQAPAPQPTSPRMRQVASELDELGAYLRKQEGR
ncbi:hypothetical protein [Streptomyces litchfieldiae]|uniref:Integral membrane protein n=1 Tax=Streptomyces litchfieldiae TaxID=3075543 RepID=A0ABU2MZA8_9ACTN|nr:hypothetical protein [Streptomyces sp. DSM 44938]MDT0346870.1 hypothetical protein [Streptomyces sp. DSM 44938]